MKYFFTLLFASSLFISTAIAQTPQGISYQAIAFNSGGTPVTNGNVAVKINILDNSITGTVVYSETHTKTTNAQGLFNLNIGEGTPTTGTFSSINWGTNSKFLKVELDPNGGTNYSSVGTNQLMSVPYALYAKNVENINASSIVGSVEPDSNGIGVMTSSTGYAFNNGQWYSQSLGGTPQKIISTSKNIGIMTSGFGYAFKTNQWYSQSLGGTVQKIIGSSGNICIMTSSTGYAFYNGQWYSQSLGGTINELVTNQGVFGIMTSSTGYAFNNGQWYTQSLGGTVQKIVAKSGRILIYTSSTAYTFDSSLNQWYSQSLGGTPLDYAH